MNETTSPLGRSGAGVPARLADCRVAVVGLGLIGASLCMDLTRLGACREVRGISRSSQTVATGIQNGVIDQGTTRLLSGIAGADIVVLAAPVRVAMRQIGEIRDSLKAGAIVADVGSTSSAVAQALADLPAPVQPLSTHPLAGKETSGFDAAEAGLFANAIWVLTPLPRTSPAAVDLFSQLVRAVGAHPLSLEAAEHDRIVSAISHVPFLVSSALVRTVAQVARQEPGVWELAAGGFRDTSRVAASEASMFLDILMTNRTNIGQHLEMFMQEIAYLRQLLDEANEEELEKQLTANRQTRMNWYAAYAARNRPAI